MSQNVERFKQYKQYGAWKTVKSFMDLADENDFKNYFQTVKKYSLVRQYEKEGFPADKILNYKNFQTLLTSHNTYLMQNKLTRPDCCYIMTENRINSLFNSTDKEIREAHNLEKMYINGAFNE